MKNRRVCVSIFLTAVFTLGFTHGVFANQDMDMMIIGEEEYELPQISQDEAEKIQEIQQSKRDEVEVTPKAAAAALYYLEIRYVGSSNIGWEYINPSQWITVEDHGGALMRIVTLELGYGCNPIAKMGGGQLPWSSNYHTDSMCWNSSGYLGICEPGQVVVGFRKYWNIDGWQNGYFTYQNTSCNYPYNTMSDAISIK